MTNHQLIQTICYGAPHGLQVQWNNTIWTIDPNLQTINETSIIQKRITIGFAIYLVENKKSKLLLHSTRKLTENILDDENDFFYQLNIELCDILGTSQCEYFVNNLIGKKYYAMDINKFQEVNQFLIENHFNLFNLSEEYFTEKSTFKF